MKGYMLHWVVIALVYFNLDQSPIYFVLFCLSFTTLTFSKIAGQLFCSMSHNLDLPDYFLMIRFRLKFLARILHQWCCVLLIASGCLVILLFFFFVLPLWVLSKDQLINKIFKPRNKYNVKNIYYEHQLYQASCQTFKTYYHLNLITILQKNWGSKKLNNLPKDTKWLKNMCVCARELSLSLSYTHFIIWSQGSWSSWGSSRDKWRTVTLDTSWGDLSSFQPLDYYREGTENKLSAVYTKFFHTWKCSYLEMGHISTIAKKIGQWFHKLL